MKQVTKSSLSIMFAGFLWGVVGIFTKQMSYCGFDSYQIVFTRMGVSGIVFAIYLLIYDKSKFKIELKDIWMFFCTGFVCIFLHNVTLFYSIIHGESSIACVLVNSSPIHIMLVSALLFNDKITKRKVIALIITIVGCVFVSGVLNKKMSVKPFLIFLSLISGFLYGMYTIFSRFALRKYNNQTINFYTFTFAFLGSLLFVNVPQTVSVMFGSSRALLTSVSNGVITCLLPFFFYTAGLKYIENSKASILVSVDPIIATLSGIVVLKETCSAFKLIGCALIIFSIILLNTKPKKLSD